jgi:hypothetical protein
MSNSFVEPATDDRIYHDDPAPAVQSDGVAEVVSLDNMRSSVITSMPANFEQDDLDVPAFLRKRNEVM